MAKNIVITGASSGIGRKIAESLIKDGNNVIVCARSISPLKELTANGKIASYFKVDVSKKSQIIHFTKFVSSKFGHVDALICCAGVYGAIGPFWEVDDEDWWATIKINLLGTFLTIKYFTPLLKQAKNSSIVTFAGGGAFNSFPRYSAYASSKSAIVRLTETIAEELKSFNIKVNAVAPGFISTPIHNATIEAGPKIVGEEFYNETKKKLKDSHGKIEVPINCVKYLISDRADGLTGKTISANFDPWRSDDFFKQITNINNSDLYTMKRINKVNIPENEKWKGFK